MQYLVNIMFHKHKNIKVYYFIKILFSMCYFLNVFPKKNLRSQVLNHCPILLPHIDSVATSTKGKVGKHFFFQVSAKYYQDLLLC